MSEAAHGRAPETGDPRVDDALRDLDDLSGVPVDEHAERLSAAHQALQDVLRAPDDRPSGPQPSQPLPSRPLPSASRS